MRNKNSEKGKKVVAAMSGGIDSSLTAALLKKQGYFVIGVFMRFWNPPSSSRENRYCSFEAEKRAREIAKKLDIPFYIINVEKEFKKKVVNYFLKEYKAGNTPNPCVVCNKEIKFGFLLEKALKMGADYVATGHYAKIKSSRNLQTNYRFTNKEKFVNSKQIRYSLISARDKDKDQSYFLWQLNQKQLSRILFPIGDYTKEEVKKMAKKFKLPEFKISESMEVCFVQKTINDFLKNYLGIKVGKIIDSKGKEVGKHQGLWFYTIGQRKGINLPQGPYYVTGKDFKKNILFVSKNKKDLLSKELIAKNVNWISGKEPKLPLKIKAKIRYCHKFVSAIIIKKENAPHNKKLYVGQTKYKIRFISSQSAITPGQSIVFYRKDEVLGGGIIVK